MGPSRGTLDYKDVAFDSFNSQAPVLCEGCGRTFLKEGLTKH